MYNNIPTRTYKAHPQAIEHSGLAQLNDKHIVQE